MVPSHPSLQTAPPHWTSVQRRIRPRSSQQEGHPTKYFNCLMVQEPLLTPSANCHMTFASQRNISTFWHQTSKYKWCKNEKNSSHKGGNFTQMGRHKSKAVVRTTCQNGAQWKHRHSTHLNTTNQVSTQPTSIQQNHPQCVHTKNTTRTGKIPTCSSKIPHKTNIDYSG